MKELNRQIQLELDHDTAVGKYSNFMVVNHSTQEFVIDFASILPGINKAKIHTRIVLTPIHAKRLLEALENNIKVFDRNKPEKDQVETFQINLESKGEA